MLYYVTIRENYNSYNRNKEIYYKEDKTMLTALLGTAVYGVYMFGLKTACDKIVGNETYEEYLIRMANKEAEEQRKKWSKERA